MNKKLLSEGYANIDCPVPRPPNGPPPAEDYDLLTEVMHNYFINLTSVGLSSYDAKRFLEWETLRMPRRFDLVPSHRSGYKHSERK